MAALEEAAAQHHFVHRASDAHVQAGVGRRCGGGPHADGTGRASDVCRVGADGAVRSDLRHRDAARPLLGHEHRAEVPDHRRRLPRRVGEHDGRAHREVAAQRRQADVPASVGERERPFVAERREQEAAVVGRNSHRDSHRVTGRVEWGAVEIEAPREHRVLAAARCPDCEQLALICGDRELTHFAARHGGGDHQWGFQHHRGLRVSRAPAESGHGVQSDHRDPHQPPALPHRARSLSQGSRSPPRCWPPRQHTTTLGPAMMGARRHRAGAHGRRWPWPSPASPSPSPMTRARSRLARSASMDVTATTESSATDSNSVTPRSMGAGAFRGAPRVSGCATSPAEGCGSCTPADADGDGYEALGCGGLDCDDTRAGVAPGRTETCDPAGIDEDCRPSSHGILDADGDGYTSSRCCNGDRCGPDCDDAQSSIGPGAPEACNGIDEDCDGVIDEGAELACTLPGAEVASCIDGRCAPLRCAEGRDDCDGRASNGCEADLRWDASACGGCDAPCSAGQSCADGVCVQICGPSFHNCPEGCVPNWSELSCGDRCDPCPAPRMA
jgi:hypothetical protein